MPGEMSLPASEGVEHAAHNEIVPTAFSLQSNYPNPFNPTTAISFTVPEAGPVTLSVYNVLGQQVATLVDGDITSGVHQVRFDAADLPSGIYLYRLVTPAGTFARKMTLAK